MLDLKNPTIDGGLCYGAYQVAEHEIAQQAIQKVVEDPTLLEYLTVIGLYIAPLLVIWRFIKMIAEMKEKYAKWRDSKKNQKGELDI